MKKVVLIYIIPLVLFSNCATIISGTKQKIVINSEPSYADVYLNLEKIGVTGEELKIKKKELTKLVTVKKEGYVDYSFEFLLKTDAVAYLNLPFTFFGFLLPAYIDEVTGAVHKAKKETYSIQLIQK